MRAKQRVATCMAAVTCYLVAGCAGQQRTPAQMSSPVAAEVIQGIADSRALAGRHGDSIWPGYSSAPFGFVYVTTERETLFCDPRVPDGFTAGPHVNALNCPSAVGPTSWRQPYLLAAMPAFGPPSVIVMGSASATGRSQADWELTILHEHFHQWQSALPGYYDRVAALDLAGGDETGMWMLNYPFPYANGAVAALHADAAQALSAALNAAPGAALDAAAAAYLRRRAAFQAAVSVQDWRYFEFQLWQEGVARWTEITIGARSDKAEIRAAAASMRQHVIDSLTASDLARDGRVAVYSMGAGEAMLLDRSNPGWRACYGQRLDLGTLLDRPCGE
jgi:hypothetical protein